MSIVDTDLNSRERARFATQLELISADAAKMAVALRRVDDSEALINLVTMTLTLGVIDDLRKIFTEAIIGAKSKAPNDASSLFSDLTKTKEN